MKRALRDASTKSPVHADVTEQIEAIEQYTGEIATAFCAGNYTSAFAIVGSIEDHLLMLRKDLQRLRTAERDNPPVHMLAENDQPTTCPQCGARTDILDLLPLQRQMHQCPNCGHCFTLEVVDEATFAEAMAGRVRCPDCNGEAMLSGKYTRSESEPPVICYRCRQCEKIFSGLERK